MCFGEYIIVSFSLLCKLQADNRNKISTIICISFCVFVCKCVFFHFILSCFNVETDFFSVVKILKIQNAQPFSNQGNHGKAKTKRFNLSPLQSSSFSSSDKYLVD